MAAARQRCGECKLYARTKPAGHVEPKTYGWCTLGEHVTHANNRAPDCYDPHGHVSVDELLAEVGGAEPGSPITRVRCPHCGAGISVEHGDEAGDIVTVTATADALPAARDMTEPETSAHELTRLRAERDHYRGYAATIDDMHAEQMRHMAEVKELHDRCAKANARAATLENVIRAALHQCTDVEGWDTEWWAARWAPAADDVLAGGTSEFAAMETP